MSKKIFITGATGFVGKHLVSFLRESKKDVRIYGTSFPEKPSSFEDFGADVLFQLDITNEKNIFETIKKIKPEIVFHLAAVSNVKYSWENRRESLDVNLIGTFNLFEALRKFSPETKVLFVSSSDVYGISPTESAAIALKEDDPSHVVNPYAFTKLSGEILSRFYAQIEGMDIIIARSFPHSGPGQTKDFVCSDWAFQIARIEKRLQEPVINVGNIDVRRDFSDVRDVVKAYALLVEKGRRGEIYNVCSGKAISLREILDIFFYSSSENVEVKIDPQKLRKADIPLLLGDNHKIRKETGWKPEIPLEQTLQSLLEYWREKVEVSS